MSISSKKSQKNFIDPGNDPGNDVGPGNEAVTKNNSLQTLKVAG